MSDRERISLNESLRISSLWVVGDSVFLKVKKGGQGRINVIYVFTT